MMILLEMEMSLPPYIPFEKVIIVSLTKQDEPEWTALAVIDGK